MKRTATATLAALMMLFCVTAAQAAPYDELQGEWVGSIPDFPDATAHLNFVDEDTLVVTMNFGGEKETMEMRYEATDDVITVYEDEDAEGEPADWEITDDGILIISPEGEDAIEFRRPGDQ